jgi:hypothetical protein
VRKPQEAAFQQFHTYEITDPSLGLWLPVIITAP